MAQDGRSSPRRERGRPGYGEGHAGGSEPEGLSQAGSTMPSINGRAITRRDLMRRVGRLEQVAGVRLVTLGDGIERGVRALEFRTGTGYAFDVLVDRSMDVGRCEFNGRSLSWLSATGVVGPWFTEPMGLGWFRAWGGGMLVTCGLDHTLLGGVDDASNFHQLVQPTEGHGLHRRVGFLPGRLDGCGEGCGR